MTSVFDNNGKALLRHNSVLYIQ